MTPEAILTKYWGYPAFRPLQKEIISEVMAGKDVLALLPTGGGKSICYQIPALLKEGTCLVISPLTALMQDQVARLTSLDINAVCLHAGMHYNDIQRILNNAVQNAYKLLYISPERLQTKLFNEFLPALPISMVAVDEAHCISQWGYDFRPDYLKISFLKQLFKKTPFLALTASANEEVKHDIIKQLQLPSPVVFKQSYTRPNIFYEISYSDNKNADMLQSLTGNSSIIYCRSRRQTEVLSKYLHQHNTPALHYHAGVDRKKREQYQQEWMADKSPVMVATTAFGMGIDKPDVRTVLHYDAPEHLEAYYQEAGRAGRDGRPAKAVALYNNSDIKKLQQSIAIKFPTEAYLRQVYQSVCEYLQIPITAQPDKYYPFDLADFCKKFKLEPTPAANALKLLEQEDLWTISNAVYNPATLFFTADRHVLDGLQASHPHLFYLITGVLRLHGTLFHYPTPIRTSAIAKQLKLKKDEVEKMLQHLQQMGIAEYRTPGENAQLFFHHYRVNSEHLIIDMQRIYQLKRRYEQRIKSITGYLLNTTQCRERILLSYFNEPSENDCGHCDICVAKHRKSAGKDVDIKNEILTILKESSLSIKQLLQNFNPSEKDRIIDTVRSLIDNGQLSVDKQNRLSIK